MLSDELTKRICLVKAVSQNCGDIAGIPLQGGLFLDLLDSAGCLNEGERKMVSDMTASEKNKMRTVVAMVLKKDLKTILSLVSCIMEADTILGGKIMECFKNIQDSDYDKRKDLKCWFCMLFDRVELEVYIDNFFGQGLIDLELYREASKENMSQAKKRQIWRVVCRSSGSKTNGKMILEQLRQVIHESGTHRDICTLIGERLDKGIYALQCSCGPQMQQLKVCDFEARGKGDSGHSSSYQSVSEPYSLMN